MNLKLAGLASALPLALGLGATIATAPTSPNVGAPEAVAAVVARNSVLVSDDFKLHTFGGENGTLAVTRPTGGGVQRGATGG